MKNLRSVQLRSKKKKRRALKMIVIGVLIVELLLFADGRVRPIITTIATYQAQLMATRSVNDAVIEVIAEEDVVYNSIVGITMDNSGEIASISTDMISLNRLKALITNKVSEYLERDGMDTVDIPVGTLLGGQFLSGRGPDVDFRVIPAGYVHTEIYNRFQSAGINQTLHQIMLSVQVNVTAVLPLYTVDTSIETNICIAETVIVGKVPAAYTDINGDNSDVIGLYNDYAAGSQGSAG